MLVDFHAHTRASDGSLTGRALVAAMRKRGVGICSITDHDTLAAYAELESEPASPRLIRGVEINTTVGDGEVHVLGFGFAADDAGIGALLESNRAARRGRISAIVARLREAGFALELDDVLAEAEGAQSLGRPHVAKALVRRGFVKDVDTAFRTQLSLGRPGFVPSTHLRPHDAVAAIARAGGIAVLAHPGRLRDEAVIEELVDAGLGGIEVFYPTHGPGLIARFRTVAQRFGLVMTAGSDFHDIRWNVGGVGVEGAAEDVRPFLDLVACARASGSARSGRRIRSSGRRG